MMRPENRLLICFFIVAVALNMAPAFTANSTLTDRELRVFGTTDCAYTQAVLEQLTEQGIPFHFLNIEEADSILEKMWACVERVDAGMEVALPVMVYGSHVFTDGLNQYDELVRLMAPQGPPPPVAHTIELPEFPDTLLLPDQARQFCRTLLKKCSPASYNMLQNYYALDTHFEINGYVLTLSPQPDFLEWADGYLPEELAASMNTIVHEISHGYSALAAMAQLTDSAQVFDGGRFTCFFAANNRSFLVKHDPIFPSRILDSSFPGHLKTTRYETYIFPSEELQSTQVEGIFGLAGEFSAYYVGTRAAFDLYPYFDQIAADAPEKWFDYLQSVNSTLSAYPEFKSFLLHYLLVARDEYPAYYANFLQNKPLCQAIIQIDSDFETLYDDWQKRLQIIQYDLLGRDITSYQADNCFYINNSGLELPFREMTQIEKELAKPMYRQIWQDLLR